jgi:hypothetical protein
MARLSLASVSAIFAKNVVKTIFFFAKREFAADVAEPPWRAEKPSGLRFGGSARLAESAGTRRGKKKIGDRISNGVRRAENDSERSLLFFFNLQNIFAEARSKTIC